MALKFRLRISNTLPGVVFLTAGLSGGCLSQLHCFELVKAALTNRVIVFQYTPEDAGRLEHFIPWRFGSNHVPFFSWVICTGRFQPFIFEGSLLDLQLSMLTGGRRSANKKSKHGILGPKCKWSKWSRSKSFSKWLVGTFGSWFKAFKILSRCVFLIAFAVYTLLHGVISTGAPQPKSPLGFPSNLATVAMRRLSFGWKWSLPINLHLFTGIIGFPWFSLITLHAYSTSSMVSSHMFITSCTPWN